jgi:hypothetical protein
MKASGFVIVRDEYQDKWRRVWAVAGPMEKGKWPR